MRHIKPKPKAITLPSPLPVMPDQSKSEQQVRAYFGDRLPPNYKHKPGTVILVDPSGYPILSMNDDGTCSGLDAKAFYQGSDDVPTKSPLQFKFKP